MTVVREGPRLVGDRAAAEAVARAERAEGWLARCDDAGEYVVPTRELVSALTATLSRLGTAPVLEVCAGSGALAGALRERGTEIVATDRSPPPGSSHPVERLSAADAVRRHARPVVLASFVPYDGRIHDRVLAAPHVRHYLVLGARGDVAQTLVSRLGPDAGWTADPLPAVRRRMITRHDTWVADGVPIVRRGEAWLLSRAGDPGSSQ